MQNLIQSMLRRIDLLDQQVAAAHARPWRDSVLLARLKRVRLWLKDYLESLQRAPVAALPAPRLQPAYARPRRVRRAS